MLNRRDMLLSGAGLGISASAPTVTAGPLDGVERAALRGAIDAGEFGVAPRAMDDQSRLFTRMLERAAERDQAVFLQPGIYSVSNLELPRAVRLVGVPGATRVVYGGGGHLFFGENLERFELAGILIDGGGRPLADNARGLVDLRGTPVVLLDGCEISGAARHGVSLDRCAGRLERCAITAGEAGVYAVDSHGLSITANHVRDCGDGGILVHRWAPGEDNTIVAGNRVERIAAASGGTGQNGNGINVYQAGNVVVSGNHVADCAFSAIRSNGGGNVRIANNTCLRSGETAIYSEFVFEGALVQGNVVDGAANGISICNFNEGGRLAVCSGNLVRNLRAEGPYQPDPPGFGLGISVEADTSVTGNVVEGAPAFGINIGWGPFMRDVVASGNVIRRAGYGIGVTAVEGAGSALIAGNVISGAVKGAVVGHRWADIVTGDLARGPDARFANLAVSGNMVS